MRGNLTREVFYAADGNVARVTAGAADIRRTYDEADRLLSERYYDETGTPYMLRGDYAALVNTWDEN